MNDFLPVEDFSILDDWLAAAPLWRPFRPEATHAPRTVEFADAAA